MGELTPVMQMLGPGGYVKREDLFRPFPGAGVNGAKLRQLMWLMARTPIAGVTAGAVRESPQHQMVAECARSLGVPCTLFTGGRGRPAGVPETADVVTVNPGYAGTLNARARTHAAAKSWLHVETNITLDHRHHSAAELEAFHRWGAQQVQNLPPDVETLVICAGSCTSVTSVLYGLTRWPLPSLRRVVVMGVGHDGSRYPEMIYERLEVIGQAVGERLADWYHPVCWRGAGWAAESFRERWGLPPSGGYELWHHDVYGGCGNHECRLCQHGYTTYEQLRPASIPLADGTALRLHPRYEAKSWLYTQDHPAVLAHHRQRPWLYWVVAGEAR